MRKEVERHSKVIPVVSYHKDHGIEFDSYYDCSQ
jgi:hypothetical protein